MGVVVKNLLTLVIVKRLKVERTATYPTGQTLIEGADLSGRIFKSEAIHLGKSTTHFHNYVGATYIGRRSDWSSWYQGSTPDPMVFSKELDGFARPKSWKVSALNIDGSSPSNQDWADEYCNYDGYDPDNCSRPILQIDAKRDVMGRLRGVNTRFGHPISVDGNPMSDEYHFNRFRGFTYSKRGYLQDTWKRETGAYEEAPVSLNSLIPNAIVNYDIQNLGSNVGADLWERERNPDVGSLEKIVNPDTGKVKWEAAGRHPGHRLTEIGIDSTSYSIEHDEAGRVTRSAGAEFVEYTDDGIGKIFRMKDAIKLKGGRKVDMDIRIMPGTFDGSQRGSRTIFTRTGTNTYVYPNGEQLPNGITRSAQKALGHIHNQVP